MIRASRPAQLPSAPVVQIEAVRIVEERSEPTRMPRIWTVPALVAWTHLGRMMWYRAHRAGRLRGYRLGGRLVFLEADVIAFLHAEGVPLGGEL